MIFGSFTAPFYILVVLFEKSQISNQRANRFALIIK